MEGLQSAFARARWTPRPNGHTQPAAPETEKKLAELQRRIEVLEAANLALKFELSTVKAISVHSGERSKEPRPQPEDLPRKRPTFSQILRLVARVYNTTETDLISERRDGPIIMPRHIAVYLCTRLTLHSLPRIGQHFGGRDHTTILYARDKIAELRHTDENLRAQLAAFEEKLFPQEAA